MLSLISPYRRKIFGFTPHEQPSEASTSLNSVAPSVSRGRSGNDAAQCLAEHIGRQIFFEDEEYKKKLEENPSIIINIKQRDSIKCFLQEMNKTARGLGLEHTHYSNPHGLINKYNKSSTSDQCRLTAVAMRNRLFQKIVATKIYRCQAITRNDTKRELLWYNTNKLLALEECVGVKTGITSTAGPCLSSYF